MVVGRPVPIMDGVAVRVLPRGDGGGEGGRKGGKNRVGKGIIATTRDGWVERMTMMVGLVAVPVEGEMATVV